MLKKLAVMFFVSLIVALLVIFFSITCNAQQRFSFFQSDTLSARVYLGLPPALGGPQVDTTSLSNRINAVIASMNAKLNSVDTTSLSQRINTTSVGLAAALVSIGSQASSLGTLSSTVGGLSTTVSGLSGSVGTLQTGLSGLTTTVNGLSGTVGTLSSTVSTTSTNLSALTTTVNGHTTSIASLNSGLATANTNVTNLTATVASHTTSIASLNSAVAGKQAANTIGSKPYVETGIAAGTFARYDGTQWKPVSLKFGPGLGMVGDSIYMNFNGLYYILADTTYHGKLYLGTDGLIHTAP